MLGFLGWPTPAKHESLVCEQTNIMPSRALAPTFTNKMKRKRGDGSPTSPTVDGPPLKRPMGTMGGTVLSPQAAQRTAPPEPDKSVLRQHATVDRGGDGLARRTEEQPPRQNGRGRSPCVVLPGNTMDRVADYQQRERNTQKPKSVGDVTLRRQTVESQFNLEILLKHRELRLIDQELAKCQVALEQLRRCQIIPYPAQSSTLEDMHAVSAGRGPVYNKHTPHAPPWGITEGPYTRHYQRWLIPDSAFDDNNIADNVPVPAVGGKMLPDRQTRGVKADKDLSANQARSQRGSTGLQLDALSHAYREPKQERGPMIVKRPSDGHMVKLVCLDCRRSNFNSVQGFINHCRIQHTRQFVSHSTAIEASGEEIDAETEGRVVADGNAPPQSAAGAGFVHPLIRSARPPAWEPIGSVPKRKKTTANNTLQSSPNGPPPHPQAMSTPRQNHTYHFPPNDIPPVPFKPSPQTPHLSALLAKLGRGGNLDDMVMDATTKPESDLTEPDDDEEDPSMDELDDPEPRSRSTRGVIHGGVRPASLNKSKPTITDGAVTMEGPGGGLQVPSRVPTSIIPAAYPSLYSSQQTENHDDQDNSPTYGSTPFNLSPNTTDPHPAPSLVSDDGEYDITHSESEASSQVDEGEVEDHYIHADLLDHDGLELGESSGLDLAHPAKGHGPATGRRSRASAVIHDGHGERHVSFASPVRRQRGGSTALPDEN
ncbi:MAG: hypothetical protein Q9163_005478 [Psora crenata]